MKHQTDIHSFTVPSPLDSFNMVLAGQYPGFKCYVPAKRIRNVEPQSIHESINEGPPSDGFHKDYHWNIKVGEIPQPNNPAPEPVSVSADLSVDDLGYFSMSSLSIELGPQGPAGGSAGQSGSAEGELPPGFYTASLSYDNIDYDPPGRNKAYMDFKLNACPVKIVPDENPDDPCDCDPCDCPCPCESEDDDSSSTEPGGTSEGNQTSRTAAFPMLGFSSSAGRTIQASANKINMLWQVNFGTFRGLGGVPGGKLEIVGKTFSSALWSVKSLCFNHPMERFITKSQAVPFIGSPNSLFAVSSGVRKENYLCSGDGKSVSGVGVTSKTNNAVRFVNVAGSDGQIKSPKSHIEIKGINKSATVYEIFSGKAASYSTWSGRSLTSIEFSHYLDIVRATDGSIRQIWNLWDGLVNIENISQIGYTIAFYLGSQVGGKDPVTGLYTVTGTPFKSFDIGTNEIQDRLVITERSEGREPYVCSWWQTEGAWSMSKGTGEDEIITLREKIPLTLGKYKIITTVKRGMNGEPVAQMEEIFVSTDEGTLKESRVAYAASGGREGIFTSYSYDSSGRRNEIQNQSFTAAGMSPVSNGYDTHSRQVMTYEPWAGGERKVYYTYYKDGDFYDSDINYRRVAVVRNGKPIQYLREEYAYSEINHVRRVEKRTTGLGIAETRLEVRETWLGTAPNPHAQGRLKMTQGMDGIQIHYEYEGCSDYGALYKLTREMNLNGASVPGRSTRRVSYVSANGNDLRVEEYVYLTNGIWELTDAVDYEYDRENRWIKRTRANGRVTERAMMCCGPLWEKDEDGILTSYSYNTARQLVEIIRSATETTPETIISYTRDAADHVLEERTDIGPMTTIVRTSYDLLGRPTSRTDELGRITTWAYSQDGLITTETTPTGATLITRRHADGTILELSGTGQRHIRYDIDTVKDGIRVTEKAIVGNQSITLGITVTNALDEVLREGKANTLGNCFFTHNTYNNKGWLIQKVTDNMAPTLYEYDSFGNVTKETWKLAPSPNLSNSKITSFVYTTEKRDDGLYTIITITKNNGKGTSYTEKIAELISRLSPVLESKTITTDGRGNETIRWIEYGEPTIRKIKLKIPTSSTTAVTREVDDCTVSEIDTAGVKTTYTRAWKKDGIIFTITDARSNSIVKKTDIAARIINVTDATGNVTTTEYDPRSGNPCVISNALGETVCYAYDKRGHKTAEWGTGIQATSFVYDEADRLISLITYRAENEEITTNPTERTDGDTITWTYHEASGLVTRKTYQDGTHEDSEYNRLNMLIKKTDARGIICTYTWNITKGVCYRIEYSDGTPTQDFVYNHLANMYKVIDASGTRNITYNIYNEIETDGITINGTKHTITEAFDKFGRSAGYTLVKGENTMDTISYAYGSDGHFATASFLHGHEKKIFTYTYLPGTNLLDTTTHPNDILITCAYEQYRDLAISIKATRRTTNIVQREYTYDKLERPVTRTCSRQTKTHTDSFAYNNRSELINASLGMAPYAYAYDNIGNRKTAKEATETAISYATNQLNQYLSISGDTDTPFLPEYDTAGNQTKIKTSTGIWTAVYDANNRPTSFTSENGQIIVECSYDYMGRRFLKKVSVGETITLHQFYLYRGYLQIAALDLTHNGQPMLWHTHWDPTEPFATRPLSIRKNGTWYTYGYDLTKNVTELYKMDGTIATIYNYTPFGDVTQQGIDQPFQWSSEVYDTELGMIYYNYRHYNPIDGRWLGRDPISSSYNDYAYLANSPMDQMDWLGLESSPPSECHKEENDEDKESEKDKNKDKELPPVNSEKIKEIIEKSTEHKHPKIPKRNKNITLPITSKTPKITPPKVPTAPSEAAAVGKGIKKAIGSSAIGAALNVPGNVDAARKIGAGVICVKGRTSLIKDLSDRIEGKNVDVEKRERERRKLIDPAARGAQN